MSQRELRLGILVPSSNTRLEPTISHLLSTINAHNTTINIIPYYTRVRVTEISLSSSATSQFTIDSFLTAASLLADADVHAIAWGGTSAGWLGIETDRTLCAVITEQFDVPATTPTLALLEYLALLPAEDRKVALLTPYVPAMNDAICKNLAGEGIKVLGEKGLAITENRLIANVTVKHMKAMLEEMMFKKPEVRFATVFCTNISAAGSAGVVAKPERSVVETWESLYAGTGRELTVLDSVALTVWGLLRVSDVDVKMLYGLKPLGRLFAL